MAMPTNQDAEHFDVVKDILASQVPGSVDLAFDVLVFKQLDNAFRNGVVVMIASSVHTRLSVMYRKKCRPFSLSIGWIQLLVAQKPP